MTPPISVIIPSYNSAGTVRNTLTKLLAQTVKPQEIIVVDSSTDGETPQVLSEYESQALQILHAGAQVIPAVSRNLGAAAAKGQLLLFIDADAYPASDWVERILEAYGNGYMAGGGAIEIPDFQKRKMIPLAQYFIQFNEYTPQQPSGKKLFSPSCNSYCDRDLFKKVNGFPEIRASEDVLFGLRISRETAYVFLPDARVYHIFRESMKSYLENMRLLGKYIFIYRKKEQADLFYLKGIWPVVLAPVFAMVKWFYMSARVLSSNAENMGRYLLTLPVVFVGMLWWSLGFSEGAVKHEEA